MSVMACSRRGCEHVMCDRYSSKHGYICGDCFSELLESGLDTNIKEFMDSEPGSTILEESIDRYLKEFPMPKPELPY